MPDGDAGCKTRNTKIVLYYMRPFLIGITKSAGIDGLRKARDGGDLPNPRAISNFIHRDFDEASPRLTILVMSWGQFIDHDLTLAAPPRGTYLIQ